MMKLFQRIRLNTRGWDSIWRGWDWSVASKIRGVSLAGRILIRKENKGTRDFFILDQFNFLCNPSMKSGERKDRHRRRFASHHFFRTQLKRHCSIVLCAKPCAKRLLLSPEKSSEGTLYSVPSFGGHITICYDVTTYHFWSWPGLVIECSCDSCSVSQHRFVKSVLPITAEQC